jgi:hypothetical protein
MTITFENYHDVIVYALEKIISHTRRTQQIFVAQCVWRLASIIGLEQGLIIHIDNLNSRVETTVPSKSSPVNLATTSVKPFENLRSERAVSDMPRDLQEDQRINSGSDLIHPDRRSQVETSNLDISDVNLGSPKQSLPLGITGSTKAFLRESRKERKKILKRKDCLSTTRSGKVIAIPLSTKQHKYLQSIPKGTIEADVKNRK